MVRDGPIPDADLRVEWFSGTGAGGQHRNKHQNSCRLIHVPTNTVVTAQTRSRESSYRQALQELEGRVRGKALSAHHREQASIKKVQVGSGQRGDKIRTIRFQDDVATDNRTGRKMKADRYMRGEMDQLWS